MQISVRKRVREGRVREGRHAPRASPGAPSERARRGEAGSAPLESPLVRGPARSPRARRLPPPPLTASGERPEQCERRSTATAGERRMKSVAPVPSPAVRRRRGSSRSREHSSLPLSLRPGPCSSACRPRDPTASSRFSSWCCELNTPLTASVRRPRLSNLCCSLGCLSPYSAFRERSQSGC